MYPHPQDAPKYKFPDKLNSVTTRGWETQRDFEAVIDKPLEGGQGANLFRESSLARILWMKMFIRASRTMTILTGRPFHRPLNPMFPYILDIALPPLSPAMDGYDR